MAENPFTKTDPALPAAVASPQIDRAIIAQSDPVITSGASWFWWIGGLSLVNSIMTHSGSETGFIIGLGFTLIADNMFAEHKVIAYVIDAVALTTILGLGFFARKGHLWAFITGMVLYTLDAVIYLLLQQWLAVAFHGLALFYMFRGTMALRAGLKAAADPAPPAAPPPVAI